jgi:hypothetical protein
VLSTGAPEEIRTPDPQIRSLVLYPAELRAPARPTLKAGGTAAYLEAPGVLGKGDARGGKALERLSFRLMPFPAGCDFRPARDRRWLTLAAGCRRVRLHGARKMRPEPHDPARYPACTAGKVN